MARVELPRDQGTVQTNGQTVNSGPKPRGGQGSKKRTAITLLEKDKSRKENNEDISDDKRNKGRRKIQERLQKRIDRVCEPFETFAAGMMNKENDGMMKGTVGDVGRRMLDELRRKERNKRMA